MDKKSKFRKFLTTASALAVVVGGASNAMGAATRTTTGTPANISVGSAVNLNGAFANGDNILLGGAHDIVTGGVITLGAGAGGVFGIDTGVNAAQSFNVGHAVTWGAAQDIVSIALVVNNGGSITIRDATTKAVTVNGGTLVMRETLGNGADGKLTMTAGNATVGSVNGATQFGNTAGTTITVTGTGNAANGFVGAVTTLGNGANGGDIIFNGNARAQAGVGAGGNVLNSITINNATVRFDGAVFATTLAVANGNGVADLKNDFTGATVFTANGQVTLDAGKTITGAITSTSGGVTGDTGGKLVFTGAGTVAGTIGNANNKLNQVLVNSANAVALDGTAHHAKEFRLVNGGSIINVAANGSLNGKIVANGADNGQIVFAGVGAIVGQIGDTGGFAIAKVISNGAAAVNIGAGAHKVNALHLVNANSAFDFADGANITGAITANGAAGIANFAGSGEITGTTGANGNALVTVNLNGDATKTVKFGNTITAANTNIGAGTLELNNAGDIVGVTNFTDAKNGGKLLISGAGKHSITGNVVTGVAVGGKGTISIANGVGANVVTFTGQIGDRAVVNNSLKLLSIDVANGKAIFTGNNSQITSVSFGANGGTLEFNAANATHKIGGITSAGNQGTLKITANTTFEAAAANAAVTFGANDKKLAGVEINVGQTMTVGDNISIYATQLFGTVANGGVLTFLGNSTFSAPSDGNIIADINVNGGADKVVKLLDVTSINGNAVVGAGTLEIANNFTAANLRAAALDNGTVRFTNGAAMTVTATVGSALNSLKEIEFAGGNVTFVGAVTHSAGKSFTFTDAAKAAATVTFDVATDVGGNNFVNNTTKGLKHTVILGKVGITDFLDRKLANDVTKQINFQLGAGKNVTLSGTTAAIGANFTTGADNTGNLVFNTTNAGVVNSVGAVGAKLADVQFTNTAGVTNGLFAGIANVAAGKVATLGGRISTNTFTLAGAASKVVLSDAATVDAPITATLLGQGLVQFDGGATLNKDIGTAANAVSSVTFANDKKFVEILNADNIFATSILLNKGTVNLSKNIALNGTTTTNDTSFVLNDKKLNVVANTLTFNGNNNIEVTLATSDGNVSGGQIVVGAGGVLEFDPAATIVIKTNDFQSTRAVGTNLKHTLISNNSGTNVVAAKKLDLSKVTSAQSTTSFIKFTPTIDDKGGLSIIAVDNAKEAILLSLGSKADATDKKNIDSLVAAVQGTDGAKVVDLIGKLRGANGELVSAKVDELMDRLPALTTVADAVESAASAVSMGLSQRMNNLAGSQGTPVQNKTVASSGATSGIAAGDEGARFGAWVSPFFGKTTQKENKGAAGYKSDAYGASFGFDTRANDDMIIGGAFTAASTEMKHKNFKSGDKTKISSMMFSIYGMQQITDNWFAHGVATFGSNDVKNTEKRVASLTTYDAVNGKYTSMSFNGEAMFGYNVLTEQVTFTPMAGLRYSRVNDGGYKETGSTTGQNLDVNTKASNKLEVVAGLRVAGGTFDAGGMNVTPEIHGFVNHDVIGKNPKQNLGLSGTPGIETKSNKPVKTTFNLGLGLNAEYGMMEYGAGYDAEIATKRLGHQGTLKLRVNF